MTEKTDPKVLACLVVDAKLREFPLIHALPESFKAPIFPACMIALTAAQAAPLPRKRGRD